MNEEVLIPLLVANRTMQVHPTSRAVDPTSRRQGSRTMQVQEEGFGFVMYGKSLKNLTSQRQSHPQKVDFVKDLVCFVAQFSAQDDERHVRLRFWKLRRIQQGKGHKIGWVWFRLKDGWSEDTLKALKYNYNAWTKLAEGVTYPTSEMRKRVTSVKLPNSWRSNAKESLKPAALP